MTTKNLILIVLFLGSCGPKGNDGSDIRFDSNGDTLQITYRYPSKQIREIVSYKGNKPDKNIGFSEQGDTLKFPRLLPLKSTDSLFAFIPLGKYSRVDMLIGIDCVGVAMAWPPKRLIENLSRSFMFKPSTLDEENLKKIGGAFKCKKLSDGTYHYWPFHDMDKLNAR